MLDAQTVGVIISGIVSIFGIGATYGMLRSNLKSLHGRLVDLIADQNNTNKAIWKQVNKLDDRINDHINTHLKVK